ncbi:LCP family protein [Streptomyces sp. NBC_00124]|uniref:LCP family protein n=1 Tax=Streptomyces sp. NBC_00124 TaxID=2975662 RepID=UPI002255AFAC|nr:LCP family protein [Streptomyces sp. NBC_00124]MCX5363456.1 LCP family protein [Streptomyces sp. NBC_00124]
MKRTLSSLAVPGLVLATTATLLASAALPERQAPKALNILLMGTDGRDTITAAEKRKFHAGGHACNCTDVLMLVHVSARRDRVSVVSMPRDSYADIPPYRDASSGEERAPHPSKINGAYNEGGPELSISTVESMSGVRIDRYLQVDFRRFIDAVNDVGGVEVCTSRTLKDSATKLNLKPGKHRLDGGPSLQYVRSRHVDTSADLGRIQRQHRFLANALRGLRADKALTDPVGMARVTGTLLGNGQVEQGFDAKEMVQLAAALQKVPAKAIEFTTVPIAGFNETRPDIGSTLAWDMKRADAMFAKLRADRPLLKADANPRPKDPPGLKGYGPVRGSSLTCK